MSNHTKYFKTKLYPFFSFVMGLSKILTISVLFISIHSSLQDELSHLVVAGGRNGALKSVEVLNLNNESGQVSSCQNLPDLPVNLIGPTGQLFNGSTPIICGSLGNEEEKRLCKCFALIENEWKDHPSPNICGIFSDSIILESESEQGGEQDLLLVTGGLGPFPFDIVEAFDGKSWRKSPDLKLPIPTYLHCLVRLNETGFLMVGGTSSFDRAVNTTYFYDSLSNQWTSGPSLSEARSGHSCGLMTWLNPETETEEKVVVVAGGSNGYKYATTVELLNVNQHEEAKLEWTAGPSLPKPALFSRIVEHNGSLYLIGGGGEEVKYLNLDLDIFNSLDIFQLKSIKDESWTKLDSKLKEERSQHVAFLIPEEITNC